MDGSSMSVGVERRGTDQASLKRSILEKLAYAKGKDQYHATDRDWFVATTLAVRDRVVDRWMETTRRYYQDRTTKRVYYLSLEFLIGRLLRNALANLDLTDSVYGALAELGVNPAVVLETEPDAALGNGGLGRLAACFLDSMATVGIAGYGYGIRYDYGLFRQEFRDGRQAELPEDWLRHGNPWEFYRPEISYPVEFYGQIERTTGADGVQRSVWRPGQRVIAAAHDSPVVGFGGEAVNTLRLWSAQPSTAFKLEAFNRGDYMQAVEDQVLTHTLTRVLYPNDSTEAGQELRLKQEYFFTSASLQDLLRRYLQDHERFDELPSRVAVQLNDTHPAIAVPELMRLLIDRHGVPFERAFELTRACISYTNHTLLPEALERWPVRLLGRLLPRHLELIYEINARFLADVRSRPNHPSIDSVSLIDEHGDRAVRMGNLAFVGSHTVNGVSALHTELVKTSVFAGLHACFPDRIVNQTNGITPRRWLHQCNPALAELVSATIGDAWVGELEAIEALAPAADDPGFRAKFGKAKRTNKEHLAHHIEAATDVRVDPDAMFDVHVKRIHEYKRQLLNALEAIALWDEIRNAPEAGWQPRVKIFAGKAAPSYDRAKLIIELINAIARVVNADPVASRFLKVVFLPNYNVSLAERIIPAADLSEQISTAGMEASGTGNMKLALNGAITLGTLDGANVEIREQVGPEHIFIFGLEAEEVEATRRDPNFAGGNFVGQSPRLTRALDLIMNGVFSPDEPSRYRPIVEDLLGRDYFLVTADFDSYWQAQRTVDAAFSDRDAWMKSAVLNTARVGWFSSDRAIRGYAKEIWGVLPPDAPDSSRPKLRLVG